MENVTKTLLIAAAVLVVILLIAFGMKIFNSQSDSASDAASVIGKEINLAISDAVDSTMGYSVKRYEDTMVSVKNGHYKEYFTDIEVNENFTYVISFDYTIEEKEELDIGCGIGFEKGDKVQMNADFIHRVKYPSQEKGKKNTFTYELKSNMIKNNEYYKDAKKENKKCYLCLRFARTQAKSTFKVKIENIKIKYKEN